MAEMGLDQLEAEWQQVKATAKWPRLHRGAAAIRIGPCPETVSTHRQNSLRTHETRRHEDPKPRRRMLSSFQSTTRFTPSTMAPVLKFIRSPALSSAALR